MKQQHKVQLEILKRLLFAEKLRYTDIKPNPDMENNQFDFHLKELIKAGHIQKIDQFYLLTNTGKEYANRMDTDKITISKQAKISAWVCCRRKTKKGYQYLIFTRLKQPFYGCQGFLSGKVQYGETVEQAAARELREEANLTGNPQIIMIKHFLVFDKKTKELVEDKFMFMCLFDNPKGVIKNNAEGKCEWVDKNDLPKYVTNHFESYTAFEKQVETINTFSGNIVFIEEKHMSQKF
jgi:ADP-ribose pyrophosphatase YjhB (NUDIX family)